MADGKSQAYRIITISKNKMTLEVINEIGNNFKFDMEKTK